ncbi:hypothetical protein BHE74_00030421 [Ensete ventricosum]|nr:hypothetical protein BHE74_00030421 [Ensete ventricosum]
MNSSRDFIWTLGRPFKEVAGHVGQEEEARRGLEVVALEGRRVELGRAQEAAVDRAVQEDAAVVQREVEDREPAVPWAGQDLGVLHHAGGEGDRGGGASCGSSCSFRRWKSEWLYRLQNGPEGGEFCQTYKSWLSSSQ